MGATPQTIDVYLAALPDEQRAALERVRGIIREAAPGVEEGISYGIPVFRLGGKPLLWFGAAAHHCALYGVTEPPFRDELAAFSTSGKGTVRFRADQPLPADLIRRIVAAQIAKNVA